MRKGLKKRGHSCDPRSWGVFSRKTTKPKDQNKQGKEPVGHSGPWWHSYGETGRTNRKAGQI